MSGMTSDEAAESIEVQVARTQALEADFIGLDLAEARPWPSSTACSCGSSTPTTWP